MLLNIFFAHRVDKLTAGDLLKSAGSSCDKLMIVAHPDDDALWGGAHLKEGGWLIVSVTGGWNSTRKAELEKAAESAGNIALVLEYPDKVNFQRDNWDKVRDGIEADLSALIDYKSWKTIATHNPDGEYGHEHHVMTSAIVTEACIELGKTDILNYFGVYHSAAKLPLFTDQMQRLSDEELSFKEGLLEYYESQSGTIKNLSHMNPYELWIPAAEWSSSNDSK